MLCLFFLRVNFLHRIGDRFGQRKQRQHIWNDHQIIERIGQLPHQIVGSQRAEEQKRKGDQRVHAGAALPAAFGLS